MGIEKLEMYTCVCDNCGKSADEGTEYSCWGDVQIAKEIASNCGWITNEGENKDYCPDCFEYDDQDKLIIKPKKAE